MAKSAELSQLSDKHAELTDRLNGVKSQIAAESTVSGDSKSVTGHVSVPQIVRN